MYEQPEVQILNEPNKIILHCSDTADSIQRHVKIDIDEINRWHEKRNFIPYKNIYCGYHYVITRAAAIQIGRPRNIQGVHCSGYNKNSLGVCYVGRSKFEDDQLLVTINLIKELTRKYNIPTNRVFGHYELNDTKLCPGQDMKVFRKLLI